jgi:hypothetical protein
MQSLSVVLFWRLPKGDSRGTSWGLVVLGDIMAICCGDFPDGFSELSLGTFFNMGRRVGNIFTGFFFVGREKLLLRLRTEFIFTSTFFLRFVV